MRADIVIGVSSDILAKTASQMTLPDRCAVISDCFEARLFKPIMWRAMNGRPRIVYLGRLVDLKGVDVAIKACARIAADFPGSEFCAYGDGRAKHEREHRAWNLQVSPMFYGAVPGSEVPGVLGESHVVTMPSRFEARGTTALEAMAVGRPVVGCRVGGLAETIVDGRNGLLCPVDDDAALALALSRLIGDEQFAKQLGEQAAIDAWNRFRDDVIAQEILAIYMDVIASSGSVAYRERPRA